MTIFIVSFMINCYFDDKYHQSQKHWRVHKIKIWYGGEFGDLSDTGTSLTVQLESTCILFFLWDKFFGSWIFNRRFKYCTFHFHEKHKSVCTPLRAYTLGKLGTSMRHLRRDVAMCSRFGGKYFHPSLRRIVYYVT